ncbi:family 1 glycosylhydrolase [bacterium]|nr:family 1 glycosylhydrolase [bacterium]
MNRYFFSFVAMVAAVFSHDFYWGVAISEFQNTGPEVIDNSNWTEFARESKEEFNPYLNHFEDYEPYVAALKELGVNSFRFSLEWSLLEKEEGVIDAEVVERYHQEIRALKAAGIEPFITMHHFTEPLWFTEKGGFEEQENIALFEAFAERMFCEFKGEVKYWSVINEPTVCAYMPYMLNMWPMKEKNIQKGYDVLRNLLQAHVNVYERCKKIDPSAQIGFVHSFLAYKPYHTLSPTENLAASYMTYNWNESVIQFFLTGRLKAGLPFMGSVDFTDMRAVDAFDFVGVNYYSTPILKCPNAQERQEYDTPLIPACYEGQVMTDMPYHMDPEGFYNTLMRCKEFKKPIFVTENGIADREDVNREKWIRDHIASLERAKEDGADVRGFFYWTLFDNFEWAERFTMKFGLFDACKETGEIKLKEGARAYQEIVNSSFFPFLGMKLQKESKVEKEGKEGKELVLYVKESCSYCQKVMKYLEASGTKVVIKDASLEKNRAYLLEHGKKTQVPCLFIGEKPMYESDDIISFFKAHKD